VQEPERHLTKEHLLRMVLRRYASDSWYASGSALFGQRSNAPPKALSDRGRVAASAVQARTLGELIVCVCNALDVALTDVGRRAGIPDPRMGSICRGEEPSNEESCRIRTILEEEVDRVCSKS
jgi:hypothetical protein